jgi:multisubunit Na+/H+ antiporter MnhE subunit
VFTEALVSLTPNTVVVAIDTDRRTMLVHELVPSGDPAAQTKPLPDP